MDNRAAHSVLEITDRKNLSVSGVKSILGFDKDYITLETELGRLVVEGENMKIENLIKDMKVVDVTGLITSVYYSEIKKGEGILSRLFLK